MSAQFNTPNRVSADYIATSIMTCDNNYQTGGYAVGPGTFEDSVSIDDIVPIAQSATYVAIYNKATGCIQILTDPGTGLAEVAPGTNLSALTVQLLVFGR